METSFEPLVNEMKQAVLKKGVTRYEVFRALKNTLNYSQTSYDSMFGLQLMTTKKKLRKLCRELFVDGDKYYKKLMKVNGNFLSSNEDLVQIDSECVMYPIIDYFYEIGVGGFQYNFDSRRIEMKISGGTQWVR